MRAVNLIPADQRESGIDLTGQSGGAALMVLGLVVGLAVLAFMYGSAKHGEANSKSELATVNAELASVQAQVTRLAPYKSFIAMAKERVKDVEGLVASRFDWTHSFRELGRVLPRDALITTLQGQVGSGTGSSSSSAPAASSGTAGAAPTSATPPGSTPTFTLSGCTTSQSEVAETIQRLRLMDGVANVELHSSTDAGSSAGSAGGSSPAGSGGTGAPGCAATFSATVTFTGLPSAPPTNSPGAAAR